MGDLSEVEDPKLEVYIGSNEEKKAAKCVEEKRGLFCGKYSANYGLRLSHKHSHFNYKFEVNRVGDKICVKRIGWRKDWAMKLRIKCEMDDLEVDIGSNN